MKNNSQIRAKSKYLTNIGLRFLLLCILLTSYLPKVSAEDGFMLLQSTNVTLNLTNVSLETLFKTLERKSNYVFFFKENVLQENEKVTVKAQNESVVSILNRILPPRQLTYTVKGRQVIIVRLPRKEERKSETPVELQQCTTKGVTPEQVADLLFANKVVKHSKSNSIVLAKNKMLIASGVGETSRVDALKHAIEKAHNFKHDLHGAVMASDAFFPFADCVEIAHKEGVDAVIQPGGSVRDGESIDYCNNNGVAMVMTGYRHFKH